MKAATKEEKKRMAQISRCPCIVCFIHFNQMTMAEVHHLVDTGRRRGHKFTIPLCVPHHREGFNNKVVVSTHPYKAEFNRRYGSDDYLLEETNKIIDNYE